MHHTGIKTYGYLKDLEEGKRFQLHHTGIKTWVEIDGDWCVFNFNCTIQELKLKIKGLVIPPDVDFNCTIQELKHKEGRIVYEIYGISIAPYRN